LSHYGLATSEYDGSYQQLLPYIQPVERTSVAEIVRQAIHNRSDVNIGYQVTWCKNATGDDTAAYALSGIKDVLKGPVNDINKNSFKCH